MARDCNRAPRNGQRGSGGGVDENKCANEEICEISFHAGIPEVQASVVATRRPAAIASEICEALNGPAARPRSS